MTKFLKIFYYQHKFKLDKKNFFKEGYLFLYPEVRNSNLEPWEHFVLFGYSKGYSNGLNPPQNVFDKEVYLYLYSDVRENGCDPWVHYVTIGNKEGRLGTSLIQKGALSGSSKGKFLLITHELSVTGAPLSLKSLANILIKRGYFVELWTFPTIIEKNFFSDISCSVRVVPKRCDYFYSLLNKATVFDFIVCNTVLTCHYVKFFFDNHIRHLWMIREGKNIFPLLESERFDYKFFEEDLSNITVVSEYVQDLVYSVTGLKIRVLHNYLDDEYFNIVGMCQSLLVPQNNKGRFVFSICGTLSRIKGVEECINAFLNIDKKFNNKWSLHIIGKLNPCLSYYWKPLVEKTADYKNIFWEGELTGKDKWDCFLSTDVFLIPSKDEPFSRIVLEAAMLKKTFVVSRNVGAKFIAENNAGFICNTDDLHEFTECLTNILMLPRQSLLEMGQRARENFLTMTSAEDFEKKFFEIARL